MNVTFNSDTVAFLIHEIDDILSNADITAGMCDDLSNFLNALAVIIRDGPIVIVHDDDNLGDSWDDDSDGYPPDDDGPNDDGGELAPIGWTVADT
jgi:hypothetical protein